MEEGRRRLILDVLSESSFRVVAAALHDAGIPFVPVKGIVLARWLYKDLRKRPYCDVDLLVPRREFSSAIEVVASKAWRVFYQSSEMGEISFVVGDVAVEIHAEVGRKDLSRLTVDQVLARATPDRETFPFEILHIDDIDHFLLLVINVVKDGFVYANLHQPEDLSRMIDRLRPQWLAVIGRAKNVGLVTALNTTTDWMIQEHGSEPFCEFKGLLPKSGRPLFESAVKLHRRMTTRRPDRLQDAGALIGLALATLTPDDVSLRWRGTLRTIRRGAYRYLGRIPG